METNTIVQKTTRLIDFLNYLLLSEENRKQYLESPKTIQDKFDLEGIVDFRKLNNLFDRFIKDDQIWRALQERDKRKLKKIVNEKFPEWKSNDIEGGAIIINDVLAANSSIVIGQQIAVALSTLKAVVAIAGVSPEKFD